MTRRFQFSLKILLLTIAAVAVVLALTFQVTPAFAGPTLAILVVVESALAITGLTNGQPGLRTFCAGALIPLGIMLALMVKNSETLFRAVDLAYIDTWGVHFPRLFGFGILMSIALGYLCVGFRLLIEPRS